MKQSGLPATAVAGTSGSVTAEKARHTLRKARKVKETTAPKGELLPKPEPAKREKGALPASTPEPRFTVKDFIRSHLGSE